MEYYLILLLLSIVGLFLSYNKQKTLSILMIIFMSGICCLRGVDVGTDTITYMNFSMGHDTDGFGPLYSLFAFFAQLTPFPPTVFLTIISILTYIPLLIICSKYSKMPCLTLFLFMSTTAIYFLETFNICRQALAIMYVLLAIIQYDEKGNENEFYTIRQIHNVKTGKGNIYKKTSFSNKTISISLLCFAFIAHPYTILIAPLFILKNINLTRDKMMLYIVISVFLGLFVSEYVMTFLISILSMLFGGSSSYLLSHLTKYTTYDYSSEYTFIGRVAHILPYIFLLLFTYRKEYANTLIYKMMFWGFVLLSISLSSIFSERIACTYTIAIIVALPNIYFSLTKRQKMYTFLVFAYLVYRYISDMQVMALSNLNYPVPYKFIFENGI